MEATRAKYRAVVVAMPPQETTGNSENLLKELEASSPSIAEAENPSR